MGRPFLEKFADVQWEVSEEQLQAWKDGKTGYPIVDAAMRACKARGEFIFFCEVPGLPADRIM